MNSASAADLNGAGGPAASGGGAGGRGGWYDFYGGMGGGTNGVTATTPTFSGDGTNGASGSGTGGNGSSIYGSGIPSNVTGSSIGATNANRGTSGGGGGGGGTGWIYDSTQVTNPVISNGEVLLDFFPAGKAQPVGILGGFGGNGSCDGSSQDCGGGGGGGAALAINAQDTSYTIRVKSGSLIGGAGGSGYSAAAGGGGGGAGLVVTGSGSVIIDRAKTPGLGSIIGGSGATTGGGNGGAGILLQSNANLTTMGSGLQTVSQSIMGGSSATGYTGPNPERYNLPGSAVVFAGDNATYQAQGEYILANPQTIGGGSSYGLAVDMQGDNNRFVLGYSGMNKPTMISQFNSAPSLPVINISGDNNTVEIQPDAVIDGFLLSTGQNTHIVIGGDSSTYGSNQKGQFTLDDIGDNQKYRGINTFLEKNGDLLWTVSGTQSASNEWHIVDGVFQLGNNATIAASDRLTIGTTATPAGSTPTFDLSLFSRQSGTSVKTLAGTAQALISDCKPSDRAAGNCINIVPHGLVGLTITDGQSDTYAGQINISGPLTLAGGTQTFIGNINNVGAVNVTGGVLKLGDGTTDGNFGVSNRPVTISTNGQLIVNNANDWTFSARLEGDGTLTKQGTNTLTFDQNGGFSGHAAIEAGTLKIGSGGETGAFGAATVNNNSNLVFDRTTDYTFAGIIDGTGAIEKNNTNILTLSGNSNSFTGTTNVNAGTLAVTGQLGGQLEVKTGATLQSSGMNGSVGKTTIDDGAFLSGAHDSKLSFTDDLFLSNNSNVNVSFSLPSTTELFNVAGNLTLDGKLNVVTLENSGPGYYRIFKYSGTLQDNTMEIGSTPNGVNAGDLSIITTNPNSVDLYDAGGAPVGQYNFWIGGDGTWDTETTSTQWTDAQGTATGAWENGAFAIFRGAPGTVTVSNTWDQVEAMGMQFFVDGYTVTGDTLMLTGSAPIIRVGDGTGAAASMTATILAPIAGNAASNAIGMEKQGLGKLIIAGDNTYTGITKITQGTLQIGNGGTTGKVLGNIINNDTLAFNKSSNDDITGTISGNGRVINDGTGTTRLSGHNSFSGGVEVNNGTVQAGTDNDAFGSGILTVNANGQADLDNHNITVSGLQGSGNVSLGSGNLSLRQIVNTTFSGVISGSGGLNKDGHGVLILSGNNTYTGTTVITNGSVQIGNGGNSGSIAGNVTVETQTSFIINRSDDFTFGNTIDGGGEVKHSGSGVTTFTGNNTYTGDLFVHSGTVKAGVDNNAFGAGYLMVDAAATADLNGFDTTTGGLYGAGKVLLNNATLTLNQELNSEFSGQMSGNGGLVKNGTGELRLSGANTYTGSTIVNSGVLHQEAAGSFSSASAYQTGPSGTLELGGFSTIIASLQNGGSVVFGGLGGATLTTTGNYTGNNGTIVINAVLGGDNSKTDKLNVKGDTSGSTKVAVINQGGKGAQTVNGVKIIEVDGKSNGSFSLQGHFTTDSGETAVVAGAYAYTLHQGGVDTPDDGDWYLRSERSTPGPLINPGVPLYQGAIHSMQALNKLPTMQQRIGNRIWTGSANPVLEQGDGSSGIEAAPAPQDFAKMDGRAVWGRIEGAHSRLRSYSSNADGRENIDTFLMQAGVDGQFYDTENGQLLGGIFGQYGNAKSAISSLDGDGSVNTNGWGLGAVLTWYGENGVYVDTQGQATWYRNNFNSDTADAILAEDKKGFGYALSIEAGQKIAVNERWAITPQAQLMWSSVTFNGFDDIWNAAVAADDGNLLTGRVGVAASYQSAWRDKNGMLARSSVYGIANIYQDFINDAAISVDNTRFSSQDDRTWGGLGLGGTYAWADDKYAVFGEGLVNTSLNHFGDSYTLKANLGFRTSW